MSDVPRQPPPKKEVALALLEGSSLFVHLDPRRAGVLVPKGFAGQHQLVLQVGLNMAIPIPDLKVDDIGVSCTLSFNRSPFWCRLPWSAIYALVGEDGRGMVWPDDVPQEVASQMQKQQQQGPQPGKAAPGKKSRPKLAAVESEEDIARREANEKSKPTPIRRGLEAVPPARSAPRAVPNPEPAPRSIGGSEAEVLPMDNEDSPELAPVPQAPAARGKKVKRELPPYLRVIK
jgi:stringent starvation protein B